MTLNDSEISTQIPEGYIILDEWELLYTHGKSFLIGNGEPESSEDFEKKWLPQSQVYIDVDDSVYVAEWLAVKEDLV